jgi:hypothetical protein
VDVTGFYDVVHRRRDVRGEFTGAPVPTEAPAVLGRHAIADAGLYSVCLAIGNLWLAATAEDLGVGGHDR